MWRETFLLPTSLAIQMDKLADGFIPAVLSSACRHGVDQRRVCLAPPHLRREAKWRRRRRRLLLGIIATLVNVNQAA